MIQPAILRRRRAFLALTGRLALAAGCAPLSWAAGANPRIRAPKKKLLLDTDIGSDIDDAVALAKSLDRSVLISRLSRVSNLLVSLRSKRSNYRKQYTERYRGTIIQRRP